MLHETHVVAAVDDWDLESVLVIVAAIFFFVSKLQIFLLVDGYSMWCVDGKISVWNCHRIFCSCHRERTGSDTLNICALWARSCFIVSDFLGSDRIFQIFRLQQLILLALLAYNFLLKLCSWSFQMHWLLQYFIKIIVCSFHSGNNLLMAWCAQLLHFFLFFALFCVEKSIIFDASFCLVRFRGQMRLRLL